MSWLERVTRPKRLTTTLVFHRSDTDDPIIHNLHGLWRDQALLGLLDCLVQEYFDAALVPVCEVLWQEGERTWGTELLLDIVEAGD